VTDLDSVQMDRVLRATFGSQVSVRARRPGLFQINLPAILGDGDGALIFVRRLADGRLELSDLGHTAMRASYTQPWSEKMREPLAALAKSQGFEFVDGSVVSRVPDDQLLAGIFGLVQVQSKAEITLLASVQRQERSDQFRGKAREVLREAFPDAAFDYTDRVLDADGLYPIDMLIPGPRQLAVALVANDNDAASATMAKMKALQGSMAASRPRWAAVVRDLRDLSQVSQRRLINEDFKIPTAEWDDRHMRQVIERLADLADRGGGTFPGGTPTVAAGAPVR